MRSINDDLADGTLSPVERDTVDSMRDLKPGDRIEVERLNPGWRLTVQRQKHNDGVKL